MFDPWHRYPRSTSSAEPRPPPHCWIPSASSSSPIWPSPTPPRPRPPAPPSPPAHQLPPPRPRDRRPRGAGGRAAEGQLPGARGPGHRPRVRHQPRSARAARPAPGRRGRPPQLRLSHRRRRADHSRRRRARGSARGARESGSPRSRWKPRCGSPARSRGRRSPRSWPTAVARLAAKYHDDGRPGGRRFRLLAAVHPAPEAKAAESPRSEKTLTDRRRPPRAFEMSLDLDATPDESGARSPRPRSWCAGSRWTRGSRRGRWHDVWSWGDSGELGNADRCLGARPAAAAWSRRTLGPTTPEGRPSAAAGRTGPDRDGVHPRDPPGQDPAPAGAFGLRERRRVGQRGRGHHRRLAGGAREPPSLPGAAPRPGPPSGRPWLTTSLLARRPGPGWSAQAASGSPRRD